MVVLVLAGLWFVFGGERAEQSSELEARERLESTVGGPSSTTAADAAPLTAGPPLGLYRYQGSGREVTTFPPLTEEQGPAMPATVTAGPDGCWVVRIDVNTHHWQEWTYCTQDGRVTERSSANFSRRNLGGANIDNTSTFTCDPPVVVLEATDAAGVTRPRSCTGTGSLIPEATTSAGTITVVGREQLDVGGTPVATTHVRYDLTYVGAQSGTETTDLWFDSATGMPVRNEHRIRVDTETPFGPITYTEDGRYTLQTPRPV